MLILKHNTLVLALLLLCCTAGFAQRKALTAAESAAVKAKITANTRSLQTLQSDFIQTKQLSYMDKAIRSTGKLHFKAPGKIRWEYLSPTNYVAIFDGQTMHTIADGRTKSTNLVANRRMQGLNDLLMGSLQGDDMLDEHQFDITYYREKNDYIVVQVPKDKGIGRYIRQVELVFDGNGLLLSQVTLTDPAGDHTKIVFSNQRENAPIPDAMFQP